MPQRKIIHIDMDAFYAAIEQRDFPEYRGKPLIVGGLKDGRGVVATASYEARVFGVRSAMPSIHAARLCRDAIFVKPRMNVYREESQKIMEIIRSYSHLVEPLSLDEAYLDVTENKKNEPLASKLAKQICEEIYTITKLTASAGVAPNKFLAKVASDLNKPNGVCVIPPHRVDEVLQTLVVRKIPGVGSKTEERMKSLGIHSINDLRQMGLGDLTNIFGKRGKWFYETARGIDEREVKAIRKRKSISVENTFSTDLIDLDEIEEKLGILAERLEQRMQSKELEGRTITLKITFNDFRKITRSVTTETSISSAKDLANIAVSLLEDTKAGLFPLRLLGISVSSFDKIEELEPERSFEQLSFAF